MIMRVNGFFSALVCLAIGSACHLLTASVSQAEGGSTGLRAAFVEKDITPEIGMEYPGGYGKVFHRKFHDPCKARIGVFNDGDPEQGKTVAVISLDAAFIRKPQVQAIRTRIEKATGIPAGNILVHATHSHSSGPTGMVLPGEYDHASKFIQELAYQKSSGAVPKYLKLVEDQAVAGVIEAWKKIAPASFDVDRGYEDRVAYNRRFIMKNGMTVTHPRAGNPDIVKPAGPIDPEVGVLGVFDEKGKLQGCVINYVCHATTNPGGISANYIYYVEKAVQGMFGKDVVVVFIAGASGDVTQVDNQNPRVPKRGEAMAAFVGGRIGAEAVKVLLGMDRGTDCVIDARQKFLKIPRRKPSPAHVALARKQVHMKYPKEIDPTTWTFAKETVMLDALIQAKPIVEAEIQALQIGPLVIAAVPAEYFCQYGLDIKKGSPFPFTFVASLSNGCVGYVPTVDAFGPHGGGYETRLTSYSNLEITAGNTFAETAIQLTRQFKPGPVPEAPAIPKFTGSVWRYGDNPPQVD